MYKRSAEHPDALILESDDVPGTRTKDVFAVSGTDGRLSIGEPLLFIVIKPDISLLIIMSRTLNLTDKLTSSFLPSNPLDDISRRDQMVVPQNAL
jgi:hypothetical protein